MNLLDLSRGSSAGASGLALVDGTPIGFAPSGAATPTILGFRPEDAEVWDSPGMIVATVKMLTAAVTGAKVELGNNRKVTM